MMKNKERIIAIVSAILVLLILIIDCKKELALHRIVRYTDTGVLSQDLLYKYDFLWLEMLEINNLYLHIDIITISISAVFMIIAIAGLVLKKDIIIRIGSVGNCIFILIPFIYSLFLSQSYLHTKVVYRLSLIGLILVVLAITPIVIPLYKAIVNRLQNKKPGTQHPVQKYTDELKELSDLLNSGVITQEEFDAKKKELLNL